MKYRGLDLVFSPGATGGPTAVEMLNVLAQFPAAKVGYETPGGLHLRAEALRYAFLDRLRHLADPLAVRVPWRGLASREYAAEVAAGLRVAGPRSEAKLPDAWAHDVAVGGLGRGKAAPRGRRRVPTEGADCTTHICAVDRQRNMVSLTNTAVSLFGSRMVVPGTGILLQNGMLWFDPEPGRANSVAPGKRPVVNMVPALGFRQGEPYLTVGAPGADPPGERRALLGQAQADPRAQPADRAALGQERLLDVRRRRRGRVRHLPGRAAPAPRPPGDRDPHVLHSHPLAADLL